MRKEIICVPAIRHRILRFKGDEKLEYWGLKLSVRTYHCLMAGGIGSIKELLTYSKEDLLKLRYLGRITLGEIENVLWEIGLLLK